MTRNITSRTKTAFQKAIAFACSPKAYRWVIALFILQAVFLVFVVRLHTPPDEKNHIDFIKYYASHSVDPFFNDQVPTYNLGDKTREVDYMYHYSMSLLMRVMPFSETVELHIMRLFSVVFAVLTLLLLIKVFQRLKFSPGVITTGLLVMTNLPMVLFMSSAINNDTLVWLGMAAGMLLILRLIEKPRLLDLLLLAELSVVGGLFKRTLLPIGLAFGFILIIILVKNYAKLQRQLQNADWKIWATVAVLVLSLGLFIERVGMNIVRYHSIAPKCHQVQGVAACYDYWSNVRARDLAKRPEKLMLPTTFAVRWTEETLVNVVDLQTQGWRHEVKPARILTPILSFFLIAGLLYGAFYEWKRFAKDALSRKRTLIAVIALYAVGIQFAVNFVYYHGIKVFGIALNGRYVLPSLLPLAIFATFYWAQLLKQYPNVRVGLAVLTVILTIVGSGLWMMLSNPQLRLG